MATRKTELPGVGTKHTLDLSTGQELVVVEHRSRRWEITRLSPEGDVKDSLPLQQDEASELGRILQRGSPEREDPRKQMLFEEFAIEWVTLDSASPLVGQTLLGSGIWVRTGVSVIAVLRPDGSVPSPPPDLEFQAGETLVVIGLRDQVDRFLETFAPIAPAE